MMVRDWPRLARVFVFILGSLCVGGTLHAETVPRDTMVGNVVFMMPKGWTQQKFGEHTLLLPPGQKLPHPAVGIVLTRSVPNLDIDIRTYLTRVADYFEGGQAKRDDIQVTRDRDTDIAFMRSAQPMPAGAMVRFYHAANPKGQGEAIMLFAFSEAQDVKPVFERFLGSIGYVNLGDTVN